MCVCQRTGGEGVEHMEGIAFCLEDGKIGIRKMIRCFVGFQGRQVGFKLVGKGNHVFFSSLLLSLTLATHFNGVLHFSKTFVGRKKS